MKSPEAPREGAGTVVHEKESWWKEFIPSKKAIGSIALAALTALGVVEFATTRASNETHEQILFARQNVDEAMLNAKRLACATGNQLIINFNNVSVGPLKNEVAGIKDNTGDIARTFQPTTSTAMPNAPESVPPTTLPAEDASRIYNPEDTSKEMTLPCPPTPPNK